MGSSFIGQQYHFLFSLHSRFILVRVLVYFSFFYYSFDANPVYLLSTYFLFLSQGKRSCRADVWSFATTVWEIFLNCKEIPYADLTVTQVLENCGHCYQSETYCADGNRRYDDNDDEKSQRRILSRPDHCPDDLYNVMKKCWNTRIEDRPNFEEIHQYLKRLALD